MSDALERALAAYSNVDALLYVDHPADHTSSTGSSETAELVVIEEGGPVDPDAPELAEGEHWASNDGTNQVLSLDKDNQLISFELRRGGEETPEARRVRNARPHNREARRQYMASEQGQKVARAASERYRDKHPERVAAQHEARAKHGDGPEKHKCEVCGKPAEHKHHESYSNGKRVRWLCQAHHVKTHHPKSDLPEAKDQQENRKAMTNISDLIRGRNIQAEIEAVSKSSMQGLPSVDGLTGGATQSVPMYQHNRPGPGGSGATAHEGGMPSDSAVSGLGGGPQGVPMVDHPRPSSGGEGHGMDKAIPPQFMQGKKDDEKDEGKKDDEKKPPFLKPDAEKACAPDGAQVEKAKAAAALPHPDTKIPSPDDEVSEVEKALGINQTLSRARQLSEMVGLDELQRAVADTGAGEQIGGAGEIHAQSLSVHSGASPNAEPFRGPMTGIHGPGVGAEIEAFSDQDKPHDQQLSDWPIPIVQASSPAGGAGPSQLEASVNERWGGDISKGPAAPVIGAHRGPLNPDLDVLRSAELAKARALIAEANSNVHIGVGVPPPPPAQAQEPQAVVYQNGFLVFSDAEDRQIAKAYDEAERRGNRSLDLDPSFDIRSAMHDKVLCKGCKAAVPAMFTVCPSCGTDHTTGLHGFEPTVLGPTIPQVYNRQAERNLFFPDGNIPLE